MTRLVVDGMSVFKNQAGAAAHLDRGYTYSFLTQINAAVKKLEPTDVIIAWEGGHKKRSALLPGYKANRTSSTQLVQDEREITKSLMRVLGVDQCMAPGHEADDVIASLVNSAARPQVIMSGDKDMLQLVRPGVSVYQKVRGAGAKTERKVITSANFAEMTGWASPEQFLRAHCALGDAVDCVPKLAGVGETVIHAYFMGSDIPAKKRATLEAFYNNSPQYLLNRELINLTTAHVLDEIILDPGQLREGEAYQLLVDLGFSSIAAKFHDWVVPWHKACGVADIPTVS